MNAFLSNIMNSNFYYFYFSGAFYFDELSDLPEQEYNYLVRSLLPFPMPKLKIHLTLNKQDHYE